MEMEPLDSMVITFFLGGGENILNRKKVNDENTFTYFYDETGPCVNTTAFIISFCLQGAKVNMSSLR